MRAIWAALGLVAAGCASVEQAEPMRTYAVADHVVRMAGDLPEVTGIRVSMAETFNPLFAEPFPPSIRAMAHHHTVTGLDALPVDVAFNQVPQQVRGFTRDSEGLTHVASGLRCPDRWSFNIEGLNLSDLVLTDVRSYEEEDGDVECEYRAEQGLISFSLRATKWPEMTAALHVRGSVLLLQERLPSAVPTEIAVAQVQGDPSTRTLVKGTSGAGLEFTEEGLSGVVAVYITKVGDWHIKGQVIMVPRDDRVLAVATLIQQFSAVRVDRIQLELLQNESV
ncbi:MAG: hypothetical protein AAF830_01685 [Pseudomonadota bacterium]